MSATPILLILGSGPRIGAAVAQHFASNGYLVAIASRKGSNGKSPEGYLSIQADLSDPSCLPKVFAAVKTEYKSLPNIVVYNAAALTAPTSNNLFSIPVESLAENMNANSVSVYAAAKEAVEEWKTLSGQGKKVFIYTGNKQNMGPGPLLLTVTLGMGKSATSYLMGAADGRYKEDGYRYVSCHDSMIERDGLI
jgi:NAD(P)-dependent dehydrogenase (short-subunit alcohol dehydrogenase family)